jgi:hypothetical protein
MAIDATRTARGALAGAAAAALWAVQQPLDKRLFDSAYDDVELLGRAATSGENWYAAGFGIHAANGALFGAVYANVAPSLPVPVWARGPAVSIAENIAAWPLGRLSDRWHPQRNKLPKLTGNRRAYAQATWRHFLFGVALGEIERRLNPPEPEPEPDVSMYVSSNGHGRLEHATVAETP